MKCTKLVMIFALLLGWVTNSFAYDFVVNGIAYTVIGENQVEVSANDNVYSGEIVIPSTVSYSDVTYSVVSIGQYAFKDAENMEDIVVPSSVVTLGYGCFALSTFQSGHSIKFLGEIESLGEFSFNGCKGVVDVPLKEGMSVIPRAAFQKSSLRNIKLPSTVTEIGIAAFFRCDLESIDFGESLTHICERAFKECYNLRDVVFPQTIQLIDYQAFYNVAFENVNLPNSVTTLGVSTFRSCPYLRNVKLPSNVNFTTICNGTFQDCPSLEKLIIPANVTTIEKEAFQVLTASVCNLRYIQVKNTTPPSLASDSFEAGVPAQCTLFVPDGCIEAYKQAANWSAFFKDKNGNDKPVYDKPAVDVSVSAQPVLGGTIYGAGMFLGGADITITATPANKYYLDSWTYEGIVADKSIENQLSFTLSETKANEILAANGSIEITANFKKIHSDVTLAVEGEGTVKFSNDSYGNPQTFDIDDQAIISAKAADNYTFVKWTKTVDGVTEDFASATLASIKATDKNTTYTAVFAEKTKYTLAVRSNIPAASDLEIKDYTLHVGEQMTLNFNVNAGYKFEKWTISDKDDDTSETTQVVRTDKEVEEGATVTYTAVFSEVKTSSLALAVQNNVGGSVAFTNSAYTNPLTMNEGSKVSIVATASEHYTFEKWIVSQLGQLDVENTDASVEVTFTDKDVTYTAVFKEDDKYTLSLSSNIADACSFATTSYQLYKGQEQQISFSINNGYEFVKWIINNDETDTDLNQSPKVTMGTSALSYQAVFKKSSYTVTVNIVGEGSVNNLKESYEYGKDATIFAQAADGYTFQGWSGDVESTDATLEISSIAANMTITATFLKVETPTDVVAVDTDASLKAYAVNNTIKINTTAEKVVVYDLKGNKIYSGAPVDVTVALKGVYVVKAGAETVKVSVK